VTTGELTTSKFIFARSVVLLYTSCTIESPYLRSQPRIGCGR